MNCMKEYAIDLNIQHSVGFLWKHVRTRSEMCASTLNRSRFVVELRNKMYIEELCTFNKQKNGPHSNSVAQALRKNFCVASIWLVIRPHADIQAHSIAHMLWPGHRSRNTHERTRARARARRRHSQVKGRFRIL